MRRAMEVRSVPTLPLVQQKKTSTMRPMISQIIGFQLWGGIEGITKQLQPYVCYRVRSSITCSHRISTYTTSLHPKLKSYCPTCCLCGHSERWCHYWQLSCRTYALTLSGSKVVTCGVRTLQYQRYGTWNPTTRLDPMTRISSTVGS
jgi:hypothetical protein